MAQNSRKRPAPGAAPLLPVVPMPRNYTSPPPDDLLQWSTNGMPEGPNYNDLSRSYLMGGTQGPFQQQQQQIPLQSAPPQQGHLQPQSLQPQQTQQQQQLRPHAQQHTSTAVARRPPNRALIPSVPRPAFDTGVVDPFASLGDDPASFFGTQGNGPNQMINTGGHGSGPGGVGLPGENESIEVLEERAQRIKKEAQAKRKQIPPFVQKLSSFLEEQKNTELIRWSENGDSFIVLDEDEFARTLIPELFKHNNYASFVRQLNMYGFHKRVGLSDNSMKASERKNKSPSEYYNPYFRRGHPNLLWLINKPKSGSKAKRGKREDGDIDSDDDGGLEDASLYGLQHNGAGLQGFGGNQQGRNFTANASTAGALGGLDAGDDMGLGGNSSMNNNLGVSGTSAELAPLQKKDFQIIKDELHTLRSRQAQISKVMQRLQYDNAQLQQQARMFQNMHERHENSINAILNFLANVFRKSLEEQGGVQGVTELLASILPNGQMPQGSVVDLGDDFDNRRPSDTTTALSTPLKRPQRLLPPIPAVSSASNSSNVSASASASVSPSARTTGNRVPKAKPESGGGVLSPSSQQLAAALGGGGIGQGYRPSTQQPHQPAMGSVTELFDSPGDSTFLQQELHSNPHEGMMKIINDTNANTPSSLIDLPEMAATTPVSLTSDQRNRVLNLMSGQTQGAQASTSDLQRALSANNTLSPGAPGAGGLPVTGPSGVPLSSTAPPAAGNMADLPNMRGGGGVGQAAPAPAPSTALSPILANMGAVPPPPSLKDISNTQAEIEALQRLQDEQNAKITDLSQLLGPLSPSGRVPGLEDDSISSHPLSGGPGGQSPGYFDLGQYLDANAFGEDFNFATGDPAAAAGPGAGSAQQANTASGQDLDGASFGFDGRWDDMENGGENGAGGNSAHDTGIGDGADGLIHAGQDGTGLFDKSPSPAPTEEILRTDLNSPTSNSKRRRIS